MAKTAQFCKKKLNDAKTYTKNAIHIPLLYAGKRAHTRKHTLRHPHKCTHTNPPHACISKY
jgi:hypothetical protein